MGSNNRCSNSFFVRSMDRRIIADDIRRIFTKLVFGRAFGGLYSRDYRLTDIVKRSVIRMIEERGPVGEHSHSSLIVDTKHYRTKGYILREVPPACGYCSPSKSF